MAGGELDSEKALEKIRPVPEARFPRHGS